MFDKEIFLNQPTILFYKWITMTRVLRSAK